ncbi:MAG: hypothetical protein K2H95_00270 [Bacteroidales bacterium]|nr:hypothetical protein [Bacteroidales bacterium]
MKKILKYCLISIAIVIGVIFVNGCHYVFFGQEKSMNKLQQGKELNLYECCSIYSMHMATWMFGWTFAPEAAKECFLLHLPYTNGKIIDLEMTNGIRASKKIESAINSLSNKPVGASVNVAWTGTEAYALKSIEHNAAIALNPCKITKTNECQCLGDVCPELYHLEITAPFIYPKYSRTQFNLEKVTIIVHEGLFRYLQDKGWLTKYTVRYEVTN